MRGSSPLRADGRLAGRDHRRAGAPLAAVLFAAVLCAGSPLRADPPPVPVGERIPYGKQPINYDSPAADNRVARLAEAIDAGRVRLEHEGATGYLRSLLEALEVPLESQVLVFSKSSLNKRLIEPGTPRALYFNDDTYVGWVPEADQIEISTVDDHKGALFYMLPQSTEQQKLRFARDSRCLACHAGASSLQVPGHLVRSFATDKRGKLLWGYSQVSHDTPLARRWAGWYVTGRHGKQSHRGNLIGQEQFDRQDEEPGLGGNVTELAEYFDTSRYLSPHSDLVALLVLDHQTYAQNLLTRLRYDYLLEREDDVTEAAVRYLLFADEQEFAGPVEGTTAFAAWYQRQGPHDNQGRSLRDLDLETRLLKYRLSPVIYSSQFDALPGPVKDRLYRRLWEVLAGRDTSDAFSHLGPAERKAILRIVRETKQGLPDYWRAERDDAGGASPAGE